MTNILVLKFSSSGDPDQLTRLCRELKKKDFNFYLVSSDRNLLKKFRQSGWPGQKIWLGPESNTILAKFIFLCFAPWIILKLFLILLWWRIFKKTKRIYLLTFRDKILATWPAKILAYKIFWQENYLLKNKFALTRIFYSLATRGVNLITCFHTFQKQLINLGAASRKIQVIYAGIDLTNFRRQENLFREVVQRARGQNQSSQFIIGTVGHLTRELGIEYLLKAFKQACQFVPFLELIIVGEGPEKQNLIWLTKHLEIDKFTHFVGLEKDALKWIGHFHLFVWTPLEEEVGAEILLKAMALRKAVLAFKTKSVSEIVAAGKTGTLIEPKNIEMFTQALINLYHHPDWLKMMGQNGRARVEDKFSLEKMAGEYERVFKS